MRWGGRYARWSPWLTLIAIVYLLVSLLRAQVSLQQAQAPNYGDIFNAKRETEYLSQRLDKIEALNIAGLKEEVDYMRNELSSQRLLLNGIAVAVIVNAVAAGLDWRKRRNG